MLLTATSSTSAKTKLFSTVSLSTSSSSSSSSEKEAEEEEVKDVAVEVAVASAATEVLKKPFRPFTNRLFRATSSPPPPLLSSSSSSSSSSYSNEPQQALETTEDKEEETEKCEPSSNNSTTNYHERRERADSWTPSFAPLPLSLASASSASRWTLLPSSSAHPQKLSARPQQQTQSPTTRTKAERKREREHELRELCSQMDYTDLLEAVRFHRWQVVEEVLRQGGKKLGRDPTLWQNVFRAYDGEKRSYFEEEGDGEESDEGESDGEEQQQAEKVFSFEQFEEQLRKEKRRERRYWKKVIKVLIGWRHPNVIYRYGIMLLDPVLLELLLENGLDPRKRYEKHMGWTLLHPLSLLSQNNRFTEVELRFMLLLLEHGLNINACDHQGKTLFLLLAESIDSPSQLPKLETALKLGSFINARDFNGNTALHLLDDRQVFLAEWLIKHGANRNILNDDGRSPERQALHSQNMRLATWFHSTSSHSSPQQNGNEGKKNSKKNKKAEKSIKRKGSAEDYIMRRQREEEELEEEKKRMRKEKGEEGEEEEMEQERQRRQQMTYQRQAQLKMANSALKYGFTPEWVIDEDFEECWNCRSAFKFVTRRHHCRLCGTLKRDV
ncbi:FYVE and coiled-coil domain-containing protein 1, variant 3 [Balamuthia mandrillaris]